MNSSARRPARRAATAGIAASVAAVLLVSACGTKETGGGSTSAAASGGGDLTSQAKSEGSVDYWSSWGETEPQAKVFKAEADAFTAATGIKVNIKYLGRTGGDSLTQDIASGNGPDMFDSSTDKITAREKQNMTQSEDVLLSTPIPGEDGKTMKDLMSPGVVKASTDSAGHLTVVPHTLMSLGVWYDNACSPEIADEVPKTWTDFLALLAKEKAAGKTPLSLDGTDSSYNFYWFYQLAVRFGGPGVVGGLAEDPKNWDNPAILKAATEVAKLAPYFQSGFAGSKYPAAQNEWAQCKQVLSLNGTWFASETHPQATAAGDPHTFPFPQVDGGTDSVEVGTLGWSLSAKAKHPHAAELFMSYLISKTPETQISTEALNIPARTDIPAPKALKEAQAAISSATNFTKTYDGAGDAATWMNNVLWPLDDQLITGKISPAAFVAAGKKQTADALANG